jgi:hypothetical protein
MRGQDKKDLFHAMRGQDKKDLFHAMRGQDKKIVDLYGEKIFLKCTHTQPIHQQVVNKEMQISTKQYCVGYHFFLQLFLWKIITP